MRGRVLMPAERVVVNAKERLRKVKGSIKRLAGK